MKKRVCVKLTTRRGAGFFRPLPKMKPVLARPLALVLVACAAFTDTTGAHGAAFFFALAAMPALVVATLVAIAEAVDAKGAGATLAPSFHALLSVAALGLLGVTVVSSSAALLAAQVPGTPLPALLACLGVFMLQWVLAVSEVGRRPPTRLDEAHPQAEPQRTAGETRRRRAA
jgi:hypothetical protein